MNDPSAKRPAPMIAAAAAVVALVVAALIVTKERARSGAESRPGVAGAAGEPQKTRLTLNPLLFKGEARRAYEIAARDPALLAQLHCYCGCDRELGHNSLLDCYRDDHGAHCPICLAEVLAADRLARQGVQVEQVQSILRARFGRSS